MKSVNAGGWLRDVNDNFDELAGEVANVEISIAEQVDNYIDVNCKFYDFHGNAITSIISVFGYFTQDTEGLEPKSPDRISNGGNGYGIGDYSGAAFRLITNSDGEAIIRVSNTITDTFYVVLVMPSGKTVVSGALVFEDSGT